MKAFTLYGTSACHLCELAHAMLEQEMAGAEDGCSLEADIHEVDIAGDDLLFDRYGVRIPVLKHPDGRELGWPFSPPELRDFLLS